MKLGTLILALAVLLSPAVAWADHCVGCGMEPVGCGCEVAHCSSCAPRCCICLPPIIPNVLRGVDRVLTGLFSCCRPCCPTDGCVDTCGCGADGYEMGPALHGPHPAADVMVDPFEDDVVVPPQARHRSRSRNQYRMGAAPNQSRGRVGRVPSRYPSRYPTRTNAATRVPTPAPRDRVTQAATPVEPAATKPRILKVEYAKPIAASRQTRPEQSPASTQGRATLQPPTFARSPEPAPPASRYPVNPLR